VTTMLERWIGDFRHAARSLGRAPGFTLVVVVTLALAIGANAAIFSVVNAVLLEPLPFPHADRLLHIGGTAPGTDQPAEFGVADELYFEYRESVPGLEDSALYGTGSSTTRAEGQVDQLFVTQATPSFFTTLGVQPLLGRLPTDADGANVVVISHWLWRTWFGSDASILNKSYSFANATRTVIGVMPPEFRFPDERVAFWVPLTIRAAQVTPGGFGPRMVARMKPGTDRAALLAQLEPLARRVQQRLGGPAPYVRIMDRHRPIVKPLREHLVGNILTPLWILLGTVAIIFLIACANVASLFTVRAENRRRDLAVRRALGAGRGDLVRSQLAEALLLAAAGGAAGALIAWAGVPVLVRAALAARPFPASPLRAWTSRRCSSPWASRFWRLSSSACCPRSASRARALAAFIRPDEASLSGISHAMRWWSCRPRRRSSCWLGRRCSCAASGSSVTSTPGTTRTASSRSRSRPAAPT
jgi:putative ABC transport system permease protein